MHADGLAVFSTEFDQFLYLYSQIYTYCSNSLMNNPQNRVIVRVYIANDCEQLVDSRASMAAVFTFCVFDYC